MRAAFRAACRADREPAATSSIPGFDGSGPQELPPECIRGAEVGILALRIFDVRSWTEDQLWVQESLKN